MLPLINVPIPPPPAIIIDVPAPPTTQQTLEQLATQHGFKINWDESPAKTVQDIAESVAEIKKRKDDAEEIAELNIALRQTGQSGFSGESGISIGEQIVLVQQVKSDLEEFCMQIEKHKNDLRSSFYEYKQQGISSEVADVYEQKYYTHVESAIGRIIENICSVDYTYLDAVTARLYDLMD